jgi:hypothetical protein
MATLQKLLFAGPMAFGHFPSDTSPVVHGLVFATELIRSPTALPDEEKKCIRDWVLRIAVPSCGRIVDPLLGMAALKCLLVWNGSNEWQQCVCLFEANTIGIVPRNEEVLLLLCFQANLHSFYHRWALPTLLYGFRREAIRAIEALLESNCRSLLVGVP